MDTTEAPRRDDDSLHPSIEAWLVQLESALALVGLGAVFVHYGLIALTPATLWTVSSLLVAALAFVALSLVARYFWSRTRHTFVQDNMIGVICVVLWIGGAAILAPLSMIPSLSGFTSLLGWSEFVIFLRGLAEIVLIIRRSAEAGLNPALVVAVSFFVLIFVGTLLLMLPRCRPEGEPAAPWRVALFTSTSACCVTGLNVVDPGTYWSRSGHIVLLGLIQLGGLGIMTFGAFFTLALGRRLQVREASTFGQLLESDKASDLRNLVFSILGFTLTIELVGAACLWDLWPDLPLGDRLFYCIFHAISAFCNAGFCLRSEGLVGWQLRWQVWLVIPMLIITGGLGFTALRNLLQWSPPAVRSLFAAILFRNSLVETGSKRSLVTPEKRLTLSTRLAFRTTLVLLFTGTVMMLAFEWNRDVHPTDIPSQIANAWFHSVTLRTAGFNTIDHELLSPPAKLLGIALMFIGASPGSTGGGVKTTTIAVAAVTLRSVLRSRDTVEVHGRTIPPEQILRSLAIIAMSLMTVILATLALTVIENRPERFLDQAYEATSAFGTVGVSANLTPTLQPLSQLVLVGTMFLGRIGSLTLIVALAGSARRADYKFPEERVALG